MSGRQIHRAGTSALSLAMVAIGIVLVAEAVGGQGVLSVRSLLGLMFVAGGSLRLYLEVRRGRKT